MSDGDDDLDVDESPRGGLPRRVSGFLRHPRAQARAHPRRPAAWIGVIYLGSLVLLFATAFWRVDSLTGQMVHDWGCRTSRRCGVEPVYRTITIRTVGIAAAVAVADIVLAFPLAYYAARMATAARARRAPGRGRVARCGRTTSSGCSRGARSPSPNGLARLRSRRRRHPACGIGATSQSAIWLTFCYLWLPVRDPADLRVARAGARLVPGGLERPRRAGLDDVPPAWSGRCRSRASWRHRSSRSRSRSATTSRRSLVGNTKFIGNVIYDSVGVANNMPLAAAFALVPVAIMAIYLSLAQAARRVRGAVDGEPNGAHRDPARRRRSRCCSCTSRW